MARDHELPGRTQENERESMIKFLIRTFGRDEAERRVRRGTRPTIPDDQHSNAD